MGQNHYTASFVYFFHDLNDRSVSGDSACSMFPTVIYGKEKPFHGVRTDFRIEQRENVSPSVRRYFHAREKM